MIPLNQTKPEDIPLPALRQDLRLLTGAPERNGQPCWLLYDPARNSYFKLGKRGFDILRHWQPGKTFADLLQFLQSKGIATEQHELETMQRFLRGNELTAAVNRDEVDQLASNATLGRRSLLIRLLHNYLFFRIPLIKADRFLEKAFPFVAPFFGGWVWPLVLLLGLTGLFVASRQWAEFTSTFLYFFDLNGLIIFALTTIIVKSAHEMGHAFTAKRYGCRVPTMGIAFMVLYPMLYTDTTDAWRLQSHRQRMQIATAGIKVELAIGMLALFFWGFLGDGILRSAAWFLASVSWVSSLFINLSPLMRFDGYYILADWLGEENLQPRSFALARWHLRRMLFGIDDPPPETLPAHRHRFFIVYAWMVWVYRFFLFLGIALMVYHFAFKALGLLLFSVEICWFILLPLWRELGVWFQRRSDMKGSVRPFATMILLGAACLLFFVPWQSYLVIPAVWKANQHSAIYPPEPGKLTKLWVTNGDRVREGQPLFQIEQEEIEEELQLLKIDEKLLLTLIERHTASLKELKSISVLRIRLSELQTRRQALKEKQQMLLVKAPFDGIVEVGMPPNTGEWVGSESPLLTLTKPGRGRITAYAPEAELHRIMENATGSFIGDEGNQRDLDVTLQMIGRTAVTQLEEPVLASTNGGPIAVRGENEQQLRPEQGLYLLDFSVNDEHITCGRMATGVVSVNCRRASLAKRIYQSAASVVIREFSF